MAETDRAPDSAAPSSPHADGAAPAPAAAAGSMTPTSAEPPQPAGEPSPAPTAQGDAAQAAGGGNQPALDPASPAAPLQALGRAIPPETIDELWIFPPRRIGPGQSTVVVASVLPTPPDASPGAPTAQERRRIFTARFTLTRGARGQPELSQDMTEEGAAPAELVARVVDGVVRRLDDEPAPPRHARIGGSPAAWAELLAGADRPEG